MKNDMKKDQRSKIKVETKSCLELKSWKVFESSLSTPTHVKRFEIEILTLSIF